MRKWSSPTTSLSAKQIAHHGPDGEGDNPIPRSRILSKLLPPTDQIQGRIPSTANYLYSYSGIMIDLRDIKSSKFELLLDIFEHALKYRKVHEQEPFSKQPTHHF